MNRITLVCVSLLVLLAPAHAWTWKGKEKIVMDAVRSAYSEAYGDNFQKAMAGCEKAHSLAGSDNYLLGIAEMCTADVEGIRHHLAPACAHYSRALSLWKTLPPNSEDPERPGKLREWTQLIGLNQKKDKCR